MLVTAPIDPIDYLVIGHLTCDLTPAGCKLGGTAAYAALTARALGLRPGIVTSCSPTLDLSPLDGIPVVNYSASESTTFKNIDSGNGRQQQILAVADSLDYYHLPDSWRTTPIIHLGPVAREIEPNIIRSLSNPLLGATIQGWLREWDESGNVYYSEWPEALYALQHMGAIVLSMEDISRNEEILVEYASASAIMAVTDGSDGVRLFWHGDVRRIATSVVNEVDTVGAGDIFSAAFFVRLYTTRDPWEAARFAAQISAISVSRSWLDSVPTQEEIEAALVEVL